MANATPVRVGQSNGAGDVDALFLKVMAGEVMTSFEETNVALQYTAVRTISEGKSAAFPTFGKGSAEYHVPGTEIVGLSQAGAEVVVTVDDLLLTHRFIANIDEAKAHFDVRAPFSTQMGRDLSVILDKHLLQLGVLAARATNVLTGEPGGSIILTGEPGAPASANFMTNGEHLAEAIYIAAQKLDEKDVPAEDRVCFVRPAQYYALVKAVKNINSDWGGKGSYSEGKVLEIAGVTIVKTNNLPNTNLSAATGVTAGTGNKYRGNFVNTAALVMYKGTIGTVKLMDLGMEAEYDIRRQGHLMVAKYAMGHGVLRPQGAVEIRNAAA